MRNVEDFMNRLHEQTSGGEEARMRQDKAIMRIIGSWMRKPTTEPELYEGWYSGWISRRSFKAGMCREGGSVGLYEEDAGRYRHDQGRVRYRL